MVAGLVIYFCTDTATASCAEARRGWRPVTSVTVARVLDGVAVAAAIRAEVRPGVEAFTRSAGRPPGLGIVLVGDDPASEIYVAQQAEVGRREPGCAPTSSGCRRRRRSPSCSRSSTR